MRSVLLQIFAICSIQAIENPIPSSYLQPRDFNPHPYKGDARRFLVPTGPTGLPDEFQGLGYEQKYHELTRRFQNTAPLQFPSVPGNEQRRQQGIEQKRRIISHIVEKQALIPHPYEQLALNFRNKQLQRFDGNDDELPHIYRALTNHARRVNNNEFQRKHFVPRAKHHNRLDVDYQDETDPIRSSSTNNDKKHYRFSYAVKDGLSGDDFSHTQKQENGAVQGSYKVQLPDGRVQIVRYTADDVHGYRADVTYEGEVHAPQLQTPPTPIRSQHQHQAFYPQVLKQVEINRVRHTVTPTPYLHAEYNIRAPTVRGFYPSTTAIPKHYY